MISQVINRVVSRTKYSEEISYTPVYHTHGSCQSFFLFIGSSHTSFTHSFPIPCEPQWVLFRDRKPPQVEQTDQLPTSTKVMKSSETKQSRQYFTLVLSSDRRRLRLETQRYRISPKIYITILPITGPDSSEFRQNSHSA